jgi:N-acetylglucosaminyldiphosphoundecaprenol N-acetyl-beta-D-mannosaminyltransferase
MDQLPRTAKILGIGVSSVDMRRAVDQISEWVRHCEARYVCAVDVNSLMQARSDKSHGVALAEADMVTPDGAPIAWVSRMKGFTDIHRVCGSDLLVEVCARLVTEGCSHYFYGGSEGISDELAARLKARFAGLKIAGCETPPFRPLTESEREEMISRIKTSHANIVWVGLGCPKQEAWMHENVRQLGGPVLIGIGAAFDFHTGRIKRAPVWMRGHGLEWLHRLCSEPRRLWRRYLVSAPKFVLLCLGEAISGPRLIDRNASN